MTLWKAYHPDNHYFATESGRVTPIYPLNKPAWSMEDICWLRADTIQRAFTMDFRSLPSADDIGDDALYQSGIRRCYKGADELERAEDGGAINA